VRRAALEHRVDPHETEMRRHDRQAGRLGDDRGIRAYSARHQRARAEALEFLVGDGGDNDLSVDAFIGGERRGRAHRRDPRLHVARAPSIYASVPLLRIERRMDHPVDADDVEMTVEHEATSAARANSRDHVRAPRRDLDHVDGKTPAAKNVGEGSSNGRFARAAGYERRISRVDSYELARERDRIAAC
jgi:hypothetical protein